MTVCPSELSPDQVLRLAARSGSPTSTNFAANRNDPAFPDRHTGRKRRRRIHRDDPARRKGRRMIHFCGKYR
jgi:hypothetical protein